MMGTIKGRSGHFHVVSIAFPPEGLTLGREQPGKGRLSFDKTSDISRAHCTVKYDEPTRRFIAAELGSSNGTFLMPEGHRLDSHEEAHCEAGQLIRFGQHNVFELLAETVVRDPRLTQELPRLAERQSLGLSAIRVPWERFYLAFVCLPTVAILPALTFLLIFRSHGSWTWLLVIAFLGLTSWISWKLLMTNWFGNAVRVGPLQSPQIDTLVNEARAILGIDAPTELVLQGHSVFEIFVACRFCRRGVLLITSNMLNALAENGFPRELMFFIGRHLGLIADRYFHLWFFKHTLGQFSTFFYWA